MKRSEILGALTLVSAAVIFFLVFYGTDEEAQKQQPEQAPTQHAQVNHQPPPDLSALINAKEKKQQGDKQESSQDQSSGEEKSASESQGNEQQSVAAQDTKDQKGQADDESDAAASTESEDSSDSESAASDEEDSSESADNKPKKESSGNDEEKSSSGGASHTVSKGETLCGISKKYYGDSSRWKKILAANSDVLDKPENLRVGMELAIPGASSKQSAEESSPEQEESESTGSPASSASKSDSGPFLLSGVCREKLYQVKKGDTLYGIAKKLYDDGDQWKKLLKANSDRLDDANDLKAGMKLVVPKEEE